MQHPWPPPAAYYKATQHRHHTLKAPPKCPEMDSAFRAFNLIDDLNREALNNTIAKSTTSERVVKELDQVIQWRGIPARIRVDNGPEFIADALKRHCDREDRKIDLVFIQKGKPSQNGHVERFNRTLREDILDRYHFNSMANLQQLSNARIWDYKKIDHMNHSTTTHQLSSS